MRLDGTRAVRLLARYGDHEAGCRHEDLRYGCTCGWEAVRSRLVAECDRHAKGDTCACPIHTSPFDCYAPEAKR